MINIHHTITLFTTILNNKTNFKKKLKFIIKQYSKLNDYY